MNIYVGNLSWQTTEDQLRDLFQAYGEVSSVNIIKDKYTGASRGFGFVEMSSDSDGQAAIQALNESEFDGRSIKVNIARPREDRGGDRRGDRRKRDRGGRRW
jgi:RNA recognition motif-containing protein